MRNLFRRSPLLVAAPLLADDGVDPHRGRDRQGAERIAVEVGDPRRQSEPLPGEGQRISGVEIVGDVDCHSLGRVTPFWPIYLPARSA